MKSPSLLSLLRSNLTGERLVAVDGGEGEPRPSCYRGKGS